MLSDAPTVSCEQSESAHLRIEEPEVATRHVLATLTSTTIYPALQRKQCGFAFSPAALAVRGLAAMILKSPPIPAPTVSEGNRRQNVPELFPKARIQKDLRVCNIDKRDAHKHG